MQKRLEGIAEEYYEFQGTIELKESAPAQAVEMFGGEAIPDIPEEIAAAIESEKLQAR